MENFKIFGGLLVALLLGIVIGGAYAPTSNLGGLVHITKEIFVSGIDAGAGIWSGSTQIVDSSGNFDGVITTSTLDASGAATLASTLAVTATTTLSDGLNLNNAGVCVNFYATSSATRVHLTASTTAGIPAGSAGLMTFDYGACAY